MHKNIRTSTATSGFTITRAETTSPKLVYILNCVNKYVGAWLTVVSSIQLWSFAFMLRITYKNGTEKNWSLRVVFQFKRTSTFQIENVQKFAKLCLKNDDKPLEKWSSCVYLTSESRSNQASGRWFERGGAVGIYSYRPDCNITVYAKKGSICGKITSGHQTAPIQQSICILIINTQQYNALSHL